MTESARPSMASQPLQTGISLNAALRHFSAISTLEKLLEAERDQLGLWLPILFGGGITAWFLLPNAAAWSGFIVLCLAIALFGLTAGHGRRTGQVLWVSGFLLAAGCGLIWAKSQWVAAPVLARPVVESFTAHVERRDALPARDMVRLVVQPVDRVDLPPRFRVNVRSADVPDGASAGAIIALKARLVPPAPPALPGGYDFARRAWFDRIGATGTALGKVEVVRPGARAVPLRARLSAHIRLRLSDGPGAIAAALATGDQGAISAADTEAMRRSGLAHLLSISGLHVTAVVGGVMLMLMKLLALSPRLALHWNLMLVAAAGGALAGIGYTLLTGSEVPTVRSCIAALLVLGGVALGREAITLRLVAAGALIVLLFWPEVLVGPSFQLSFAAVTAIVAFHQSATAKKWFSRREEGWVARLLRGFVSLLATGLVVELALIPISLVHFHKAGLYGSLANMIAIPLTTFVIMPLEALALLFDAVGAGVPFWWLAGKALALLLAVAHYVAAMPGAVAMLPVIPGWAFGSAVFGGFWLLLWQGGWRRLGLGPLLAGFAGMMTAHPPDLLVSGDGRHIAVRGSDGVVAMVRERAGDYNRDMLAESAGVDGELAQLQTMDGARCNPDFCLWAMESGDPRGTAHNRRGWSILASRSHYLAEARPLIAACRQVDIVISDRALPRGCTPRWLRLDRAALKESGGLAIFFADRPTIRQVRNSGHGHPWLQPETVAPARKWRDPRGGTAPDRASPVQQQEIGD